MKGILTAHKTRIYPTSEQEEYLRQACGISRSTYNWGLGRWIDQYKHLPEYEALDQSRKKKYNPDGKLSRKEAKRRKKATIEICERNLRNALFALETQRKADEKALHSEAEDNGVKLASFNLFDNNEYRREFNVIKKTERPWCSAVSKCVPQSALKDDLNSAFNRFLGRTATKSKKGKVVFSGFPNFRKKGEDDSFTIYADSLSCVDGILDGGMYLALPNLKGEQIRLSEPLRYRNTSKDTPLTTTKVLSITISKKANKWFCSFQCDVQRGLPPKNAPVSKSHAIGVDLGIITLATLSNGEVHAGAKALKKNGQKLKEAQRVLSRRQRCDKETDTPASNRYIKQQAKVAGLHYKLTCARVDSLHKLTDYLTKSFSVICVEDLNVSGMLKNRKLAKHIADGSFSEFKRQLMYKAGRRGCTVSFVSRWYASSRICSSCGWYNASLTLKDREYICKSCGEVHDRDMNAAINIEREGLRLMQGIDAV